MCEESLLTSAREDREGKKEMKRKRETDQNIRSLYTV